MTSTVETAWIAGPDVVPVAAPLRAVDFWRSEPADGDALRLTSRVLVRGDDPNLRGHFPDLAVFPGIFVIEALCQAMANATATPDTAEPPIVLREVKSVRFLAPLLDGDELRLDVTAKPTDAGWDVTARGTRADGTLTAKIRAGFGQGPTENQTATHLPIGETPAANREHVDVRAVLPQRHPLLLVDRVLDLDPGRSIRTIKAITGTEPCYAAVPEGPQTWRYDYPCSLMIESFGQSAALLWLDGRAPTPDDDQVLMFVGARDYRFHGTAHPGDVLRHEVRLESVVADTAFAIGETWVGDRLIATVGNLIATRRPVRPSGSEPPAGHAG